MAEEGYSTRRGGFRHYEMVCNCALPVAERTLFPAVIWPETADILFPDEKKIVVPGLKECNFGLFEYKNYQELNGNKDYQAFIDSEGMCGFPEGEDRTTFQARCVNAFCREVTDEENAAIVCHGGTIMALLNQYSSPHRDYYDWQVRNGCGWLADFIRKPEPKICNIVEI